MLYVKSHHPLLCFTPHSFSTQSIFKEMLPQTRLRRTTAHCTGTLELRGELKLQYLHTQLPNSNCSAVICFSMQYLTIELCARHANNEAVSGVRIFRVQVMKIGKEGIDMWLHRPKWAKGLAIPQPKSPLLFLWCPVEVTAQLPWAHGQLETTKRNLKHEITPVTSEHICTALLVLLKKKKQKKKKERKKTNKDWLASLVDCSSGRSFCLAASAVSGPVISFQMRKKCRLSPPPWASGRWDEE